MLRTDGYYDGNTIKTFRKVNAKKNQKVVITFLDEFVDESNTKKTARGILNDFAKVDIPDIEKLEKEAWREAAEKKHEKEQLSVCSVTTPSGLRPPPLPGGELSR